MCWNAPVSLTFTILDFGMVGYLFCRQYDNQDVTYGLLLLCIACQEMFQYLLWKDGSIELASAENPGGCSTRAIVFSFGAIYSAFAMAFMMVIRSYWKPNTNLSTKTLQWLRVSSFGVWLSGVTFLAWVIVHTGTWCVRIGPNHHQQWICALSLKELGGTHFPWLYWLYLGWYAIGIILGMATTGPIPRIDMICFLLTQSIIVGTIYLRFLYTSEACSVWCWSGFIGGLCAIGGPYLKKNPWAQKFESYLEQQQSTDTSGEQPKELAGDSGEEVGTGKGANDALLLSREEEEEEEEESQA